jgi:DDE superfamily endonuclease
MLLPKVSFISIKNYVVLFGTTTSNWKTLSIWMKQVHHFQLSLIVGCGIGTLQTANVVVDITMEKTYEAQPGRQEWVTVIECISATGEKIPPFVILKGENIMTSWIPTNISDGWKFGCTSTGWTNNFYGVVWIKHFDSMTRSNLQSLEEYRLLICNGHDSHISADFISYCIQHRIDVILLPPHSSHMLQPLDVAVFGPLKTAISNQLSRFIGMGIRWIQKVEWLERFVNAREKAITKENILSGWRGAGIFPENMHCILIQIPEVMTQHTTLTPPPVTTPITTFFPNSSPPDPTSLQSINQAFLTEISTAQVTTPIKTQIRRLSGISERLQADKTILTEQINEIQMIQAKCMEAKRETVQSQREASDNHGNGVDRSDRVRKV